MDLIFDFDGTIMDTEPSVMASFTYLFAKYRSVEEFDEATKVYVLGPGLDVLIKELFPKEDTMRLLQEYENYQREKARMLIHPMRDAHEVLRFFHAQGHHLGIVSTRYRQSLLEILGEQMPDIPFYGIVGHEDVVHMKPDPEGILKLCDGAKEKAVYVGDSVMDIEAGKSAGVVTVAIVTNEGKRAALTNAKPDYLIENFEELKAIVKQEEGFE